MANPNFRITYEMSLVGNLSYGWKTSFWNNNTTLADAQTAGRRLEDLLNEFVGVSTLINNVGYKDMRAPRLVDNDFRPFAKAGAITDTNDSDFATTSLLVELQAASGRKTTVWISGIRDQYVSQAGRLQKTSNLFTGLWNPINAELLSTNGKWCIRTMDYTKVATAIRSVDLTTGIITTEGNHGIGLGTQVKVRTTGITTPTTLRGTLKMVPETATTLRVSNWVVPPTGTVFTHRKEVFVRELAYVADQITKVTPERTTKHDRGRPTKVGIGRR